MDLPASISTGRVVGQFVVGIIDGADPDDEPDLIPARGTIAFTPSIPYLQVPVASPNPFTILETTKIGVLDALGYLCTPDPVDPSKPGARGVRLISTDNTDASVKDWTWIATPQFENVNGTVLRDVIKPTPFHLPGNETRDLTTVVKVPASEGIGTDQALALAEAAQLAAQSAASNVEGALAAAESAQEAARSAAADLAELGSDLAGAVEREITTEWTAANSSLRELATNAAITATEPLADVVAAIPAKITSAVDPKLDKDVAAETFAPIVKGGRIRAGNGALAALPDSFGAGANATIVALGREAMGRTKQVAQSIAIGSQALGNSEISRDNIAIGDSSLKNAQSLTPWYDQTKLEGTRNIAVGGNASYFLTSGYSNVAIGRNAGQCQVAGYGAVILGAGAAAGAAPIGFSGEIENGAPWGTDGQVAAVTLVGMSAAEQNSSENITGVGTSALQRNKRSAYNTAVGVRALQSIDADTGPNGGRLTQLGTLPGAYAQSGQVVTLTIAGHTLVVGDIVKLRLLDGASQTFQGDQVSVKVASVISDSVFTVTHPVPRSAEGSAAIYAKESASLLGLAEHNTALGQGAGAAQKTGGWNTYLGSNAAQTVPHATNSLVAGYVAAQNAGMLTRATIVGAGAATAVTNTLLNVTAVGQAALSKSVDGSAYTSSHENVTGIGYDSRVSGANQVQLGNPATTTYVYGTVQNRSDARDKADVRDTKLGLSFIEKLRPVDYRWDMREDYAETDDDGNTIFHERDGSRKRSRYHHGFVAQEVQKVIEETGEDFGGLQDHSVNGGADVLSIGYDEVIAPLVKAVQELSAEVARLKALS